MMLCCENVARTGLIALESVIACMKNLRNKLPVFGLVMVTMYSDMWHCLDHGVMCTLQVVLEQMIFILRCLLTIPA
jgi:hypothetical protein